MPKRPSPYQPPFKVERLSLDQVQLHKTHRQALASLDSRQLDSLAQLARLLGTVTRDDKVAEGAMLFWNQLLAVYTKEKRLKQAEVKKAVREEKEKPAKDLTWTDMLTSDL